MWLFLIVSHWPKILQQNSKLTIKSGAYDGLAALKKKFRTHVIKLDIAPMSYPPGQYLLVSASNNMLYRHSQ